MKKILLFLTSLGAFAQQPQITAPGPAHPTMQVGSTTFSIGNVTYWTGSGAPGTIALSGVGDTYLDQTNVRSYQCFAGFSPCTSWILSAGGTGGTPTGAAGGALSGTYPNPGLANIVTAATCGDSTHYPIPVYNAAGQITSCTPTSFPSSSGVTLQTGGVNNSLQTLLNIVAGTGITAVNTSGGIVTITNTGIPVFRTNGTTNASQAGLNLVAGTGMGLVESPAGTVTLTATGGGGGGGNVTASGMTAGQLVAATGATGIATPGTTSLDTAGDVTLSGYLKSIDSYPTVLQYAGCDPTGGTPSTTCFNTAFAANSIVVIPQGTWLVGQLNIPSGITIIGRGAGTILNRSGTISSGGWIDIANRTNVHLTNFLLDDGCTSSATQDYATISGPLQASFTLNTAIWIHGGSNIGLDHLIGQHACGYQVLVDATANNATGIRIESNLFQNNRPFLFGTGSDFTYGSWLGGILWISDGTSHQIKNLSVKHNFFQWIAGHAVWGATTSGAPTMVNENIEISLNHFNDIGLDGILVGPSDSVSVIGNDFLRAGGYVSTSDGALGLPKWFNACVPSTSPMAPCPGGQAPSSIPGVAIDATGLVLDYTISGNTAIAHNGGCIDVDGAGYGSIGINHCAIPQSGDPEYANATPASWGPAVGPNIGSAGLNYMYGISLGNSNDTAQGAANIAITGNTLQGQGGGAIRLYAARNVKASDNVIASPSTMFYAPVTIGNRGTDANRQGCGNEVANNKITYLGSTPFAAVYEDAQYAAFQSGCVNRVHDNALTGVNLGTFAKNVNSSSIYYGAQVVTVGTCSGTSGCQTISSNLTSNSSYGSATVSSITTQAALNGGNLEYQWYSPSGHEMLVASTNGGLYLGDGSTIGSLWVGGSQAMDVSRNFYANSLYAGGNLTIASTQDAYLNSITSNNHGGLASPYFWFDSSNNSYANSLTVNKILSIANDGTGHLHQLFVDGWTGPVSGTATIDASGNGNLNSLVVGAGGITSTLGGITAVSMTMTGSGTNTIDGSLGVVGAISSNSTVDGHGGINVNSFTVIDSSRVAHVGGVKNLTGGDWINSSGQFVGAGVNTPGYGLTAAGFNPYTASFTGVTGIPANTQEFGVPYGKVTMQGGAFIQVCTTACTNYSGFYLAGGVVFGFF
jgi:hypothetical protein